MEEHHNYWQDIAAAAGKAMLKGGTSKLQVFLARYYQAAILLMITPVRLLAALDA